MQALGAFTTSSWLPVVACAVTDCPEPPFSFTAAVEPGVPPAGTTNTWKLGPDTGAGVQRKAQPMFHDPPVILNGVLVHEPWDCTGPRSTANAPEAGAEVGVAAGADVAVLWVAGGTVVLGLLAAGGGVPVEPLAGGSV